VPAFFNEAQRSATKRAAKKAGLKVLRLLSEPMAAAMSYGLFVAGSKKVAILDMGGGTLDVSILQISDGRFEALALGGDNALGGDDVDTLMMEAALKKMSASERESIEKSPRERLVLREACEAAKIKICVEEKSQTIDQQRAWVTDTTSLCLEELVPMVKPLGTRMRLVIRRALADASLAPDQIDEVVLVGLSTKMPWVRFVASDEFHTNELCSNVHGDRAVSQGAAIQGAIMAGVDTYTLRKILMLDARPYSIGVETCSGAFSPVLVRNSKIPCSATKSFTTHRDFQRAVTIDVFEGEEPVARDNRWMDCIDCVVQGGSKLLAGEATINVTFSIDADGSLLVDAVTVQDASNGPEGKSPDEANFYLLAALLVLFFAIYIFARITVPPLTIEPE
jgi:molecular chaperone DnaK (HSP70)